MKRYLIVLLLALPASAAPVPKVDEAKRECERLWDHLRDDSNLVYTKTVCYYLTVPDAATDFFAKKLRPLELTRKDAELLIARLGAEKEGEWKEAFDELNYLDPRLALSLEDCWALAKTDDQKRRLGSVLTEDTEPLRKGVVSLHPPEKPDAHPLLQDHWVLRWREKQGDKEEWKETVSDWVAKDMGELRSRHRFYRRWINERVAVRILAQMDTPAAWRLVEAMADGHPDAEPTVAARDAVQKRDAGNRAVPQWNGKPTLAEQQARQWEDLRSGVFRERNQNPVFSFLDRPADTVTFLKGKLRPLKLERKRADELVAKLFSEKEDEWKGALAQFAVLDLRLAYPVKDAWKLAKTAEQRRRMAMALHQEGSKVRDWMERLDVEGADKPNKLATWGEKFLKDAQFFKFSFRPEVPAEVMKEFDLDRIDAFAPGDFAVLSSQLWGQQECAIYILDAIGTNDALAVIKDMATGHPDAGPTKAAKAVLKRRGR